MELCLYVRNSGVALAAIARSSGSGKRWLAAIGLMAGALIACSSPSPWETLPLALEQSPDVTTSEADVERSFEVVSMAGEPGQHCEAKGVGALGLELVNVLTDCPSGKCADSPREIPSLAISRNGGPVPVEAGSAVAASVESAVVFDDDGVVHEVVTFSLLDGSELVLLRRAYGRLLYWPPPGCSVSWDFNESAQRVTVEYEGKLVYHLFRAFRWDGPLSFAVPDPDLESGLNDELLVRSPSACVLVPSLSGSCPCGLRVSFAGTFNGADIPTLSPAYQMQAGAAGGGGRRWLWHLVSASMSAPGAEPCFDLALEGGLWQE